MNPSIAEGKAVASAPGFGVEEEEYMLAPASDDRPSPGTSQGEAPKKGQTSLKSPKTIKDAIITDSRDKNSSTLPRPSSQPSRLPNYTRDNEAIQPNSDSLDSDSEYATAWWDRGLARHLSARHLREMHPEDADFINKFFSVPPSRPEGSSSHSGPSGAGNDSSSSHGNTPLLSRSPVQTRERRQSHLPQIASQINPRSEVVMPRWQPDAEVTFCPICRTQFSFFVRKHHCRKCGRVVCYSCSPHRITIPYQYIVQPPKDSKSMEQSDNTSRLARDAARADSAPEVASLGGGESVRICNPCVPDPNTAPPPQVTHGHPLPSNTTQHACPSSTPRLFSASRSISEENQSTWGVMPSGPQRSRPSAIQGRGGGVSSSVNTPYLTSIYDSSSGSTQTGPTIGDLRSRSSTVGSNIRDTPSMSAASMFPRPLPGRPVPQQSVSSNSPNPQPHYRSLVPRDEIDQSRPLPPRPRLREEDVCPICYKEIPGRNLPNAEAIKEAHIAECIDSSIQANSRTPPAAQSNRNSMPPSSRNTSTPSTSSSSIPSPTHHFHPVADTPAARTAAREAAHAAVVLGALAQSSSPARRPHLIRYKASEKDTIDSAECTICLEEFEPGMDMGRLECFCKFHLHCITDWLNRNEQCPIHKVQVSNSGD